MIEERHSDPMFVDPFRTGRRLNMKMTSELVVELKVDKKYMIQIRRILRQRTLCGCPNLCTVVWISLQYEMNLWTLDTNHSLFYQTSFSVLMDFSDRKTRHQFPLLYKERTLSTLYGHWFVMLRFTMKRSTVKIRKINLSILKNFYYTLTFDLLN